MALRTKIEWCDSTLNLSMGCDGCELWNRKAGVKHCYAGQLTDRYGGKSSGYPRRFEEPKLFLNRLEPALHWPDLTGTERPHKPWLNGRPRLIFLGDMGDTWTESLNTEEWIVPALEQMANTPHQFLMLTKRPSRMAKFSQGFPLPRNVWPMTTVTSEKTARRISALLEVKGGGPKGLSCEPVLGPLDLGLSIADCTCCERWPSRWVRVDATVRGDWPVSHDMSVEPGIYRAESNRHGALSVVADNGKLLGIKPAEFQALGPLDWVICGGESGKGARWCHPDWARSLRDQTSAANVAFFFKQWGAWSPERPRNGKVTEIRIDRAGRDVTELSGLWDEDDTFLYAVTKKQGGRILEGVEWSQIPEVARA